MKGDRRDTGGEDIVNYRMMMSGSDSFVLNGLFIVDHSLLVEDPVPAIDALHVIIHSQPQLLPAL